MDLRAKLLQMPPADTFVSIPVEKILSQLASGSVKMSFGELRAALPGLFASYGTENDARQIGLPLKEIISRVNPTLLSRRTANKVEVADDITGPFNAQMQATAKAPEPVSTPAAPTSVAPTPTFVPKIRPPAPRLAQVAPIRIAPTAAVPTAPVKPVSPKPSFVPAATIPFSPAPQAPDENAILMPLSKLAESWPDAIKMELVQTGLMGAHASLPASLIEPGLKRGRVKIAWKNLRMMIRPKPGPVSIHDSVEVELPLKIVAPLFFASQKAAGQTKQNVSEMEEIPDLFHGSKPAEAAFSPAPAPLSMAPAAPVAPVPSMPTSPVASAAPEQAFISVPLAALSEKWPEALRREIAQWDLANAEVALPLDAVAPAMKRGRVAFTWSVLRSWIRPAPTASASAHDSTELDLPLKIIAPLFLEQKQLAARQQQRVTIDKSIPNLFFGFPSAEMEAPIAAPASEPAPGPARHALKPVDAKLSETNYYVWGDTNDTPRVDESEYKRPQAPATDFTSRYATPKEIVTRAMGLPGVTGAVVALSDGLMIASQLPPSLNADTVAAFLPQIFDRVAQSTRELRMGALNNLRFTVGNVPWHIFRVNAVYFAAFGRDGESMPTAQLASLARELDRKKQ
jgi:predicted regulator of Ras-like GTPase activity (Roadblock/LC7/MglB family)